ncbi:MAG: ATPase [bacterium]|jgi:vacuolar-type H+-ATPase subunit H|nr:ATPase [Bacillota bacterium]HHW54212.1 ATPase [Bacillota bacterium]
MEIFELFDNLEELIAEAGRIPLTGKVVVNEDELIEVIEQIRNSLPDELRQARWVLKERKRIIADAENEAREIVQQAKDYTAKLVDENEITKLARQQAEEILLKAQEEAREIRLGSHAYAERVLVKVEEVLDNLTESVQRGRAELKKDEERAQG